MREHWPVYKMKEMINHSKITHCWLNIALYELIYIMTKRDDFEKGLLALNLTFINHHVVVCNKLSSDQVIILRDSPTNMTCAK